MNIEQIRAKLKGLEEGKPKSKRWKPKDEHTVRCLPLPNDEDIAFVIKWHYGVDAGKQMYCPSTDGNDCAFCDLAKFLKSWKDEKGRDKDEATRKRDWDFFKKIDAAVKHYIPVVVRKKDAAGKLLDEVEGPYLWELTPKTYQAVLKVCVDDDYNDGHPDGGGYKVLTSLMHGLDLVVSLKKANTPGNATSYDLTSVDERKKFTAVFKGDEGAAKALLTKIPTASEIGKPVSTEEAEIIFKKWQGSMEETTDVAKDTAGVEYGSNSIETVASGGNDVDVTVAKLEAMLAGK